MQSSQLAKSAADTGLRGYHLLHQDTITLSHHLLRLPLIYLSEIYKFKKLTIIMYK